MKNSRFCTHPLNPKYSLDLTNSELGVPNQERDCCLGDYSRFIGEQTRAPRMEQVIDALIFGKWDVVLLRGIGGVGKTALAIEITRQLALDPAYSSHFGGIISLSAKDQELTPYDRNATMPEIASYDQLLRQIMVHSEWDGDIPTDLTSKEKLVRTILKDRRILLFLDNYETMEVRESRASAFLADLPPGAKTLITSRHQPLSLPAYPVDIPPLDRTEAEALAKLEAAIQHVDPTITERFLDQIVSVSEHVPLAIKWIIACSKNADHLVQLLEEHRRGKPALANLCEFCFEFEYNLLTPTAQRALCLFPLFQRAPTLRELAVAADVRDDVMQSALDQPDSIQSHYP